MEPTRDTRKSLIVVTDETKARRLVQQVRIAGYEPAVMLSAEEAIKLMAFVNYDLVLLEEEIVRSEKRLMGYVLSIPMELRRNTLFVLLTEKPMANDRLYAFAMGVDAAIPKKNIERLAANLQTVEKDHQQLYRVFKNIMG